MATITSALVLNDRMTATLTKINRAMNIILNSFEAVQKASGQAFDTSSIAAARQEIGEANAMIEEMEQSYRECNNQQAQLNQQISQGTTAAGGLMSKIKGIAATYLGLRGGINFVESALESAFESQNIKTQLSVSLKNQGLGRDAYDQIQNAAKEYGMYAQTSMTAAGAEFATYMSDSSAIESMMGTLADYATGMAVTEGLDLSTVDIADYATQLGKVLNGTFDGISKKGFTVSDAQKAILESGTDMEKAAIVADIINESWAGMYDCMANTPEGKLRTLQNTINQMEENMGTALLPAVMQLIDTVQANLPTIQQLIIGVGSEVNAIIPILAGIVDGVLSVAQYFIDNWSIIAPIIGGATAALVGYYTAQLITNGIIAASTFAKKVHAAATMMEAGATFTATVEQYGFNAALAACPITWIIVGIIAIIALFFAIIAIINKVTGSSKSAVGIITGALATAGAFIWNLLLGIFDYVLGIINYIANKFVAFANFLGNVFNDPIASIIHLFADMADNVLGIIQKIASALDFVFGSNMAATVEGWRNTLELKANAAAQKYGNGTYEDKLSEINLSVEGLGLERWAYSDAWDSGYSWGENLQKNMSLDNLLGGMDDYLGDDPFGDYSYGDTLGDISDYTGSIADNTSKTSEELSYLRDIAEKEAINRFTTAEIKVDMTGMTNRIEGGMDIDGVISYLTEGVTEALVTAGEGVY